MRKREHDNRADYCRAVRRLQGFEDIVVSEDSRGLGVGTKVMKFLARLALEKGCGAMEWYAVKDNLRALRFYERLGAQYGGPHTVLGFDQAAMIKLAGVAGE